MNEGLKQTSARGESGLRRAARVALGGAAVGLVLSLLALAQDPHRFAFAYLWGFGFVLSVSLGCLFLVALQHVTASVWSVNVRRVAELFARPMWLLGLLFIPLLVMAWRHEVFHLFAWLDPRHLGESAAQQSKTLYLNLPSFVARGVGYMLVWVLAARWFVARSLAQDDGRAGLEETARLRRWAGPFLVAFGFSLNFASYDWFMSLNPHWFSTIFGIYVFAGLAVTSLAVTTLAVLILDRAGRLTEAGLRRDHLYNFGALIFAFSCFWAYIAFSQFMLIWYGNLPEETVYYSTRAIGGWLTVSILLPVLRFALPFFLLMSRRAKMNRRWLAAVSVLVVLGQFVDLYWLVMPTLHPSVPVLGWQELGPTILAVGLLLWLVIRSWGRVRVVAVGDPLLEASRHFHL